MIVREISNFIFNLKMDEILELIKSIGPILLAIVASIIAYHHNKLSRNLSNDNLQKQLFSELNKRYDGLNDILQYVIDFSSDQIENYRVADDNTKFSDYTKAQIKYNINDYFNLCAEEFYWFKKKRIDNLIWNSWEKGMNDVYSKSIIIQDQWKEEISNGGWKSFYLDKPTDLFNLK